MFQDQWLMHTVELGVGLRSLVLVVYLELRREIRGLVFHVGMCIILLILLFLANTWILKQN